MEHNHQKCAHCEKDLPPNSPSAKRLRAVFGTSFTDKICRPCFVLLVGKIHKRKHNAESSASVANYALRAIADKKYRNFLDAEDQITQSIKKIDRKIHGLIDQIQSINAERNRFLEISKRLKDALANSPEASYEVRRMRASIYTSRADIRAFVIKRDGGKCMNCATYEDLSLDHIIPVKSGGADEIQNLQTLCRSCNSSKGDRPANYKMAQALRDAGLIPLNA